MTIEEADPLSPSRKQQLLVTENIYRCLAPCQDCTGSYVSEILGMRFICYCYCHMKSKHLVGLSHTIKVDRSNRQAVTRYLNEIDKKEEEERLQGATVPAQRHAAATSTSTLGEDTIGT